MGNTCSRLDVAVGETSLVMYGIAAWNIRASDKQEHDRARYRLPLKLRVFRDMGFQAVSLSRYAPYPEEEEEFELLREYDAVTIHIPCPAKIEELRQAVRIHRVTGRVRWVSFDAVLREDYLDYESTARCLNYAFDLLEEEGIGLLIENWTFEPEDFLLIKEKADIPDLGLLIDIGHLNLYVRRMGKRADEYIEALPLEIHELHLHDNDGVRHLHLPLHTRQGSILPIMGDAVNGLKRTGFDGIVTLEVIPYGQRVYIKDEGGMASIIRTREIFEDYWSQPTWSHV